MRVRNKYHSVFANIVLVLISVFSMLIIIELVIRYTPISDGMGWTRNESIEKRIERITEKDPNEIRILGLGDSFSDYRDEDGKNYLRYFEKHSNKNHKDINVVNLSQAGTGLKEYRNNFVKYSEIVEPDIVTIGIYLGNDIVCPENFVFVQDVKANGNNNFKDFVKRNSVLLNFIYRQAKYYFPPLRSGTFERNLAVLQEQSGISDEIVEERLNRTNPKIVELSKSDLLNPWTLPQALVYPDFFTSLYLNKDNNEITELNCFLANLGKFAQEIKTTGAEPIFILIPDSILVSKEYENYYLSMGFSIEDDLNELEKIPLIENVKDYLNTKNYYYIDLLPELRNNQSILFIPMDMHFNNNGHEVVGKAVYNEFVQIGLLN